MAVFTKRHICYKIGVLFFTLGLVAFVTGFATPRWTRFSFWLKSSPGLESSSNGTSQRQLEVSGYIGLWRFCFELQGIDSNCQSVSSYSSPDWMTAVKALQCTALGVMALSLCFFLFNNCVTKKTTFTRLLEFGTGLSGVLGTSGIILYVSKAQVGPDLTDRLPGNQEVHAYLSSALYLNMAGCGLIFIATILIAVFNRPLGHKPPPPAPTTTTLPFSSLGGNVCGNLQAGFAGSGVGSAPGTNPYAVSVVKTPHPTPALYPSLKDLGEGSVSSDAMKY